MKRTLLFFSAPFLMVGIIFLLLHKLEVPGFSPILLDQGGEILCANLSRDEKWRLPIGLDEVPPLYLKMLIAYEDKRFYSHPGVDPFALTRGLWQWLKYGRIISGGSTLTMQTVRLIRPRPRTLLYKLEEIFQALRLELVYSKKEILTMYLTLAPYGGNVEGVRAANLTYFQQDPQQMTPAQMALLVVMPQLPTALRPHIHPKKAKTFRNKVLARMQENGILTVQQLQEAMGDPIPCSRSSFPRYAPHVMDIFRKKHPFQTIHKSTLIKNKQVALESLLRSETGEFEPHQTAAALIVENDSRTIVAYVGSVDPHSEPKNGYVDMIQAVRSPGSALKPFIYALAFDENFIHPETIVEDVSTNFNGYAPTNFRDVFHGEVTIREALQQSLNIPVVHLLDRLGPGRFVDWLRQFGIGLTFSPIDRLPSLPIALGGVGIRLDDLTSLYCALANEGQYVPLSLEPRDSIPLSKPLVHPAASWYVTRILEDAPAPCGIVDWFITEKAPVAFKTGTSYGARDALCMGYRAGASGYTVGVWTGRADGSPSPNQLGRKTAAPILHKIFNSILSKRGGFMQSLPPKGVLAISTSQLPEALRWFRQDNNHNNKNTRSSGRNASHKNNNLPHLKIISPQTNTTFSLQEKGSDASSFVPIPLKIKGGKPPFFLLVNGEPTPIENASNSLQMENTVTLWRPTKAGFFELSLMDQEGRSDSVTIRLQ
jgi:penicillin-binding protein 1C